MDLNILKETLGKPVTIKSIQIYTDKIKINEYIQGILKEIKTHSIIVEQCFTEQDYMDENKHVTEREFINNEFTLTALL